MVYILYIMQYLQQSLGQHSKVKYIVLVSSCLNISTLTKHSKTQWLTKTFVFFLLISLWVSQDDCLRLQVWDQPGLAVCVPDCSLERLFSHCSHYFFSLFLDQQFPGAGFLMANHRKARDQPNSDLTRTLKAPVLLSSPPVMFSKQVIWLSPKLGKYFLGESK